MIALLSWEIFEEYVAGKPDFDPEYFFTKICYSGYSKDENLMIWLRELIKEWTPEMRTRYIKFSWGRSRLPDAKFDCTHYIYRNYCDNPDMKLPTAGTCGFSITYPNYTSKEVFKKKLEFAIVYCNEIDNDFTAGQNAVQLDFEEEQVQAEENQAEEEIRIIREEQALQESLAASIQQEISETTNIRERLRANSIRSDDQEGGLFD